MKKIALISPYEDISSLGVRTLSAYLKKRGIHTSIIHVIPVIEQEQKYVRARDDSYNIEALKKLIAQLDPDFVGASCMTNYFRRVARMLDELRGMVPLRLMGGIHPTIRPEECLEHADIVCLGEAEETLFELIQIGDTLTASRLRAVKGIGFWDEGKKVTTELRPLVDDLDKYHPIDFSFSDEFVISKGKTERVNINNALQLLPKFPFNKSMFRCNASRGCPFSCSYCCNNTLKKMWKGNGKYIRWRSVDNVINELIYAKEAICIESIRFMDDSFLHLPVEWISDFVEKYQKEVSLPFSCLSTPNNIERKKIELLYRCGLRHIQIGLQSGSDKTLKYIYKRNATTQTVYTAIETIKSVGEDINVALDVIFDNPFETFGDRIRTIRFLERIPWEFSLGQFSLSYFPATEITDMVAAKNLVSRHELDAMYDKSYKIISRNMLNGLILLASRKDIPMWVRFFLFKTPLGLLAGKLYHYVFPRRVFDFCIRKITKRRICTD